MAHESGQAVLVLGHWELAWIKPWKGAVRGARGKEPGIVSFPKLFILALIQFCSSHQSVLQRRWVSVFSMWGDPRWPPWASWGALGPSTWVSPVPERWCPQGGHLSTHWGDRTSIITVTLHVHREEVWAWPSVFLVEEWKQNPLQHRPDGTKDGEKKENDQVCLQKNKMQ